MKEQLIFIGIIFLLVMWLLFLTLSYFIWKFRHKFTREYFSTSVFIFFFLSFIVSFSFYILSEYYLLLFPFIDDLVFIEFDDRVAADEEDFLDNIFSGLKSFLIFSLFSALVSKIFSENHNKWIEKGGLKSENQFINEKDGIISGVQDDFKIFFTNHKLVKKYTPLNDFKVGKNIKIPEPLSKKKWRIYAIELLNFTPNKFKIDINEYDGKFYTAKYGANDEIIGVYCTHKELTVQETYMLIRYYREQQKKQTINRVIIITEIGQQSKIELNIESIFVELRFKNELIEELLNSKLYEQELITRYTSPIPFGNELISIKDIFVTPAVSKISSNNTNEKTVLSNSISYIMDWLIAEDKLKQLAVLGEYGQGKSTLIQHLCYNLLQEKKHLGILPFIIELKGSKPSLFSDKYAFLSTYTTKYGIDATVLLKMAELGKVLFIFDGFDEMDLQGDYNIRRKNFELIWSFAEVSKFIITGRPNYFLHDLELRTLLNISQSNIEQPYCEELHINKFELQQITSALASFGTETQNEITQIYQNSAKNSSFRDLISRPSLLFMTGLIWKDIKYAQNNSDINSAFIIEKYLEYTYKRQENKKINHMPLSSMQRAYFIQGIAVALYLKKGLVNQIKLPELNNIINDLVANIDNIVFDNNDYKEASFSFDEIRREKNLLLNDIKTCGIITRDFSGEDLYMFSHKSFLDYLVSDFAICQILDNKNKYHPNMANIIAKQLKTNILKINHNDDTLKFTSEILINQTGANSFEYTEKQKYKKLFQAIYPVKVLDNYPELAFLSIKNFSYSLIFSAICALVTIITSFLSDDYLSIISAVFFLTFINSFGVKFWFRLFFIILYPTLMFIFFKIILFVYNHHSSSNDAQSPVSEIVTYICLLFPIISCLLFHRFFLLKESLKINKLEWNEYLFWGKNKDISKLLQLWYFSSKMAGVSEETLSRFIIKKDRDELLKK